MAKTFDVYLKIYKKTSFLNPDRPKIVQKARLSKSILKFF